MLDGIGESIQLYYFMPLNIFIPSTKDGNLSYLNYIVYVGVKEKIVTVWK